MGLGIFLCTLSRQVNNYRAKNTILPSELGWWKIEALICMFAWKYMHGLHKPPAGWYFGEGLIMINKFAQAILFEYIDCRVKWYMFSWCTAPPIFLSLPISFQNSWCTKKITKKLFKTTMIVILHLYRLENISWFLVFRRVMAFRLDNLECGSPYK